MFTNTKFALLRFQRQRRRAEVRNHNITVPEEAIGQRHLASALVRFGVAACGVLIKAAAIILALGILARGGGR